MAVLMCVLCFINGAALAALAVYTIMKKAPEQGPEAQTESKADTRIVAQLENLMNYNGTEAGQKEVRYDED